MKKSTIYFYLLNGLVITVGLVLIINSQLNKIHIEKLEVGDRLSTTLNLFSLQDSVTVVFNESETIPNKPGQKDTFIGLFIYSDICEACNLNYPNWEQVRNELSSKMTFYPINMSVDEGSLGMGSSFDKYYIPSSTLNFVEEYKVPGVPYTVVISATGVVIYSKIGLIDANERKKLYRLLK